MTPYESDPRPRLGVTLGARDDAEADSFENTIAETLALTVPSVEPSASLRASIFALIDADDMLDVDSAVDDLSSVDALTVPRTVRSEARPAARPATGPSASHPSASTRPSSARSRRTLFSRLAAAGAALAVVIGGFGIVHAMQGPPGTGVAAELATVQAASDATTMTAKFASGTGSATIVASARLGKSVAVIGDAPALPQGKVYEFWYIRDGKPIPAGVFTPGKSGSTTVQLDGHYTSKDVIAATVERTGGSPVPTSAPVFQAQA